MYESLGQLDLLWAQYIEIETNSIGATMTLVVPNTGEVYALKCLLNKVSPNDVKLHLYKNNITPGETDVVGDYTESTASGYSAKTLTGSSWTITSSPATYAQQTFTYTAGPESLYGYYVTDNTGTVLIYAERFDTAPVNIQVAGGVVQITPSIGAS